MNKHSAMLGVIFLALVLICGNALAQRAPANATGNWTMYVVGTKTGETLVDHVQIAQDGDVLSGYYEGQVAGGPIKGTIHNHHIHFIAWKKNPVNFFGDVFGNRITGTYLFHGVRQTWQAVRNP